MALHFSGTQSVLDLVPSEMRASARRMEKNDEDTRGTAGPHQERQPQEEQLLGAISPEMAAEDENEDEDKFAVDAK